MGAESRQVANRHAQSDRDEIRGNSLFATASASNSFESYCFENFRARSHWFPASGRDWCRISIEPLIDSGDIVKCSAKYVFQLSLPVLVTPQSKHVCLNFVSGRGQSQTQPYSKCIVLRICVVDENRVANRRSHSTGLQSSSYKRQTGMPPSSMGAMIKCIKKSLTP